MRSDIHQLLKHDLARRLALGSSRLVRKERSSPLLSLPRELRDQIYGYVLASPTGYIFPDPGNPIEKKVGLRTYLRDLTWLRRRHPDDPPPLLFWPAEYPGRSPFLGHSEMGDLIDVSLLQTCSQICSEARHLLYELNIFVLPTSLLPARKDLQARLADRIRHVRIDVDIWQFRAGYQFETELSNLEKSLAILRSWQPARVLESITLNVAREEHVLAALFMVGNYSPVEWTRFVAVLREDYLWWENEYKESTAACSVDRCEDNTSTSGLKHNRKVRRSLEVSRPYNEGISVTYRPLIVKMRSAFGGELWIGEGPLRRLYWKDGVDIPQTS